MNLISLIPEIDTVYSTALDCCSWSVVSYCATPKGYLVSIKTDAQLVNIHFENAESEFPFQIFVCKHDGSVDEYIIDENLYHFYCERGFECDFKKRIERAVEHSQLGFERECNG